ncbi:MAG: M24 family metallopeptidase [Cytophagales bacterium]|nr:M24 family metallopeptidase [Cytophagales bacterium]
MIRIKDTLQVFALISSRLQRLALAPHINLLRYFFLKAVPNLCAGLVFISILASGQQITENDKDPSPSDKVNLYPGDYLDKSFHKERREALRKYLSPNSVAVFFANPVRNRANDVDYLYHQDPDFYYLTGLREPHAVLLIFSGNQEGEDFEEGNTGNKEIKGINGRVRPRLQKNEGYNEIIFVQQSNPYMEMWTGKMLGIKGVKNKLGFEKVLPNTAFKNFNIDFKHFDKILFLNFYNDVRDDQQDEGDLYSLIVQFKKKINALDRENYSRELHSIMNSLREIKTEAELKLLRRAIKISAIGQIEVMKAMHANMSEAEIQGIHEFVYKKYGAEYEGYPSIVGSGNNGCVLHYITNNRTNVGNNLVLMDLGAEYRGYTADVTRTIPANGKFSEEQKQIYKIVYQAQEKAFKSCKKGNPFNAPHRTAKKIISEGLIALGIIQSESEVSRYFPHGTSHYLGLDVHDRGNHGTLEPGMVITVEPGIYIPEGSDCDQKWWGIAVRIEDDILITETGWKNLSKLAPRKIDEIEAMMAKESTLDDFVLPDINKEIGK